MGGKNDRVVLTHHLATMVSTRQLPGRAAFAAIVLVPDSIGVRLNQTGLRKQFTCRSGKATSPNQNAGLV